MPIRHLSPKTEDELKKSVKGLSIKEKVEFAEKHNLKWLKREAYNDLKKIYKKLSTDEKFEYAQHLKQPWLQKIAEKEFKKENKNIAPSFELLYEYLKSKLGDKFDYSVEYNSNTSYILSMNFSADDIYFLIQQRGAKIGTPRPNEKPNVFPEIKVAKKTGDIYFFTDEKTIHSVDQMIKYCENKIKELKK